LRGRHTRLRFVLVYRLISSTQSLKQWWPEAPERQRGDAWGNVDRGMAGKCA